MSSWVVRLTTEPSIYYLPIVYIVGMIGNIINLIVFSRSKLRYNSCSLYFVCMSACHLLMLNCPCLFRIIAVWSNYNVFSRINVLCKLSTYLDVLSLVLSRNFLCLISINRWMITSSQVYFRRQASPRRVRWTAFLTVLFWLLFNIHSAIGYYTLNDIACVAARDYAMFSSVCHIVVAVVPVMIMMVFSTLTLMNLRDVGRRVDPLFSTTSQHPVGQQRRRKREIQFIRLSLLQVLLYIILNSLRTVMPFLVYYITAVNNVSSGDRETLYMLFYWGTYLLYTYAAVGFDMFSASMHTFVST